MGWITLTAREQMLNLEINDLELQDLQLSRRLRRVHKELSRDQSIFNANKKEELLAIKEDYNKVKDKRTSFEYGSDEYNQWQMDYASAREDYEAQKLEIEEYWDDRNNEVEEEATDKENEIQDEQTVLESRLESIKSELETVKDAKSKDIDRQKLNMKN